MSRELHTKGCEPAIDATGNVTVCNVSELVNEGKIIVL